MARYCVISAVAIILTFGICCAHEAAAKPEDSALGSTIFEQKCQPCHGGSNEHAPKTDVLRLMSPAVIFKAITVGPMKMMAAGLSVEEKQKIVGFLTSGKIEDAKHEHPPLMCKSKSSFDYSKHPSASGWGISNVKNSRFIPSAVADLTPDSVKRLKLKWAFAFPNTTTPRAQPAIAGGAIFVGDEFGDVYALDAKTGCVRWQFEADTFVRTAISISQWQGDLAPKDGREPTIFFGDQMAQTYAVSAISGKLKWKTKVDDDPLSVHTGAASLVQSANGNVLYVPVSAPLLDLLPNNPEYPCCQSRGSVSALDADTGKILWKSYTIPEAATQRGANIKGVAKYGPSGAGVWNSPTIDEARGRLYIGTGENASDPPLNGGAVMAMNLRDGSIAWVTQLYPAEAYNDACNQQDQTNCPESYKGRVGLDVAASPVLLKDENGREVLVAAQKPGDVIGIDPDNGGKILWRRRIVRGDFNNGVLFGMASEGRRIFASALSVKADPRKETYWGIEELGLYALDAFSGAPLWRAPLSDHCHSEKPCAGYGAALTTVPGVLFAGAMDGWFRAFDTSSGHLIWEFDTARKFTALNGAIAQGGTMNGPGAVVADGMVYVNSGYYNGNAFLAFSVDGK